jgi:hypothetical protein
MQHTENAPTAPGKGVPEAIRILAVCHQLPVGVPLREDLRFKTVNESL